MIIRLILAVIIFYILYRIAEEVFSQKRSVYRNQPQPPTAESEELVKDPCCGVYIPSSQASRLHIDGETHYFCSKECQEKFRQRG